MPPAEGTAPYGSATQANNSNQPKKEREDLISKYRSELISEAEADIRRNAIHGLPIPLPPEKPVHRLLRLLLRLE